MKRYATATVLVSILMTMAHADEDYEPIEVCTDLSLVAKGIMTARQNNRPLSEALPAAQKHFGVLMDKYGIEVDEEDNATVAEMVMGAYDQPSYDASGNQTRMISDFENAMFAECYKGLTSDSEYAPENERRVAADDSPAMEAYQFAIAQTIRRNWSVPASASSDTHCIAEVEQLPSGEIIEVTILSCNGDDAVRRSVETAIHRSSPLPQPSDPALFRPKIELSLMPEQGD